jgi:AcrR family transcriptional regulator
VPPSNVTSPSAPVRRRPGGRSERVRRSVLGATILELAEHGYQGLRFEGVAVRAGVHKTTVYRRWSDRPTLVREALLELTAEPFAIPDTGSTRQDLRTFIGSISAFIGDPLATEIFRFLISDAMKIPELRSFARETWDRRFARAEHILVRAVARGELPPGTDTTLMIQTAITPVYLRVLITGETVDQAFADRLVDVVLGSA